MCKEVFLNSIKQKIAWPKNHFFVLSKISLQLLLQSLLALGIMTSVDLYVF